MSSRTSRWCDAYIYALLCAVLGVIVPIAFVTRTSLGTQDIVVTFTVVSDRSRDLRPLVIRPRDVEDAIRSVVARRTIRVHDVTVFEPGEQIRSGVSARVFATVKRISSDMNVTNYVMTQVFESWDPECLSPYMLETSVRDVDIQLVDDAMAEDLPLPVVASVPQGPSFPAPLPPDWKLANPPVPVAQKPECPSTGAPPGPPAVPPDAPDSRPRSFTAPSSPGPPAAVGDTLEK